MYDELYLTVGGVVGIVCGVALAYAMNSPYIFIYWIAGSGVGGLVGIAVGKKINAHLKKRAKKRYLDGIDYYLR